MSTHNGRQYVKEAVASVLGQSYGNLELIIIDDASDDGTDQVIESLSDERIRRLRNKECLGLMKSLNRGVRESRGQYIARIDDDDIWSDPEKLAKQVAIMEKHPAVGLVGTQVQIVAPDKTPLYVLRYPETDEELRSQMLYRNQFIHSSVVIRRRALDEVGLYSEKLRYAEDYELWLRIGKKYELANLPDVCVLFRQRRQSISGRNRLRQFAEFVGSAYRYRSSYPNFYRYVPVYFKELVLNMVR